MKIGFQSPNKFGQMRKMIAVLLVISLLLLTACGQKAETNKTDTSGVFDKMLTGLSDKKTENPVDTTSKTDDETPANVEAKTLYDKEIEFDKFPTEVMLNLPDSSSVSASFESDKDVRFVVYSEDRYNIWKETDQHTISKANTKDSTGCCKKTGSFRFDINKGEGGNYYFIFENNAELKENTATKAKLTVKVNGGI